eukprot:CAMPEP_0195122784 /NCGR_PEP_ID=MMETSP0448-20130528/127254_1 /TAXON_ID=66468 /ORGANISM="Heterocapsa triquestra, Strain CCMP 448" /LENGTH=58 /DNA_ID=CAMNT_0040160295 /DNA_START=1 /DNA_END=174 /DNA_ORIENTATION=+
MLAGAGAFVFISAGTTAQWIYDGCQEFHAEGLWDQAGRIKKQMRHAHDQYMLLHGGWE